MEEHQIPNMVYAPHWYDLDSLFNKNMVNLLLMCKVCHGCVRLLRYDFRHDPMLHSGDVSSQGFLLGP